MHGGIQVLLKLLKLDKLMILSSQLQLKKAHKRSESDEWCAYSETNQLAFFLNELKSLNNAEKCQISLGQGNRFPAKTKARLSSSKSRLETAQSSYELPGRCRRITKGFFLSNSSSMTYFSKDFSIGTSNCSSLSSRMRMPITRANSNFVMNFDVRIGMSADVFMFERL